MKKVFYGLGIVLAIALMIASIPLVNNVACAATLRKLTSITPQPLYTVVESLSSVGRFVGNGDGAQYFAAVLVQSEADEADLRAYYEPLG